MNTLNITPVNRHEAIDLGSPSILGLLADLGTNLSDTFANWVRGASGDGEGRG